MSTIEERVKSLNEERMRAWDAQHALLDAAVKEGRGLTAEEKETDARLDADIARLDEARDLIFRNDKIQAEREAMNEEINRISTPAERHDSREAEARQVSDFFGAGHGHRDLTVDIGSAQRWTEAWRAGARGQELRVIAGDVGASGGSLTIPTTVASSIYEFLTASTAMRRMRTTIVTTNSGEPMQFPKVATHGIATRIADQDTTFGGTDAVLGATTLNAYDYGQLCYVANDFIEDTGTDVLGFVVSNIGRALGIVTSTEYVSGDGSSDPNGVMTAVTGAGTIATGGSVLAPTFEKLIDLVYSVNDNYRAAGAEWLMRDLTAATVRKIRDGAGGTTGAFIWQPSPTVGLAGGQPDRLLGYPVFTDPNVASLASSAKIIAFGDFSAYYIRDVRGVRLERSDHFAFGKNHVAFRGLLRTDGDLADTTGAINIMIARVA